MALKINLEQIRRTLELHGLDLSGRIESYGGNHVFTFRKGAAPRNTEEFQAALAAELKKMRLPVTVQVIEKGKKVQLISAAARAEELREAVRFLKTKRQ
ncbi:MAG: hypothetical protein ABIG96_03225 [Candidatus Micrarchaeota archaeon]